METKKRDDKGIGIWKKSANVVLGKVQERVYSVVVVLEGTSDGDGGLGGADTIEKRITNNNGL